MNNIYFIAEIGVNHEAKLNNAYKHILLAKKGGAQAIKLQSYKAEKIVSKYAKAYWDKSEEKENNQLKLYKKYDGFNDEEYLKIYKFCKKIKIDFIITPFDLDTISFFKNKVKYFKISSSDITNFPLIEKISKTKKPIILSTGASSKNEISNAIKLIKKRNRRITILQCILNYPTKKNNVNLNMIDDLKTFGYEVGLSDHTKPKDAHQILLYAYIKGVRVFEKHFTTNKKKRGNDHFHSFDFKDLRKFFNKVEEINKILGKNKKEFLESEIKSRLNARRRIFYKKDLKKNQIVKKDDLIMLRPSTGMCPSKINTVIGKVLKKNKIKNEFVRLSDFK